jgi:hypothetical protein
MLAGWGLECGSDGSRRTKRILRHRCNDFRESISLRIPPTGVGGSFTPAWGMVVAASVNHPQTAICGIGGVDGSDCRLAWTIHRLPSVGLAGIQSVAGPATAQTCVLDTAKDFVPSVSNASLHWDVLSDVSFEGSAIIRAGGSTHLLLQATPGMGRTRWILILCAWTIVGLLFVAQRIVVEKVQGAHVNWVIVAALELVYWYIWAAYTPLVMGLAKRFR